VALGFNFSNKNSARLTGAARFYDDATARRLDSFADYAAFGAMMTPLFAMTHAVAISIAFMNGNAAFSRTNDDFGRSGQHSNYRCGNSSAQNKQTHFSTPLNPLMANNAPIAE
jgi:hypothetical protein